MVEDLAQGRGRSAGQPYIEAVGKARTSGGGLAKRALVLLTLCVLFAAGVGTAAASGNGNGKPDSRPVRASASTATQEAVPRRPAARARQGLRGARQPGRGERGPLRRRHGAGAASADDDGQPAASADDDGYDDDHRRRRPRRQRLCLQSAASVDDDDVSVATPEREPVQEEPSEERAPSATPPKATTPKTNDAPTKAKQETAEPKQGVSGRDTRHGEERAGCAPPRVLAVAPKTAEGQLPFTGLPLWFFVLGGLAALLAGVGVRRLARAGRHTAE